MKRSKWRHEHQPTPHSMAVHLCCQWYGESQSSFAFRDHLAVPTIRQEFFNSNTTISQLLPSLPQGSNWPHVSTRKPTKGEKVANPTDQ